MKFSKRLNAIVFPEDWRIGARLIGGVEESSPTGKYCWKMNRLIGTFKSEPKRFFAGSKEISSDK